MDYEEKKIVWWYLFIIFVLFIVFNMVVYFYLTNVEVSKNKIKKDIKKVHVEEVQKKEKEKRDREETLKEQLLSQVYADSFLISEYSDEKNILEKNSNKIQPIASLTKIMTAIVALDKKEKTVLLTNRAIQSQGEYGFRKYEEFLLDEAVKYMLIGSVNDIASAIALGKKNINTNLFNFIEFMNKKAVNLDMLNTLFFSETGLDITTKIKGSYSTANDIKKIIKIFNDKYNYIAKQTILNGYRMCSINKKICHNTENTNILLKEYPEIIFSKTGYTKKAGGSLGVILDINNKKYIIVILKSGKKERFDDLIKIIDFLKAL